MNLSQLKLEIRFAVAFAILRTAFCTFRAWHQAISHDEAFTFQRYLNGPWSDLWTVSFDANNHVLYTFLAKCSTALFGLSDFSLRLPSVLAGLAMMLGIFRVLEPCRSRFVRWLAYVALGLHPLLLDFSIAARGYGLALAFLVWAVDALQRERLPRAGALLGLAISSNLTAVFPSLALITAVGFFSVLHGRTRAAISIFIPAASIATAICYYPMRAASRVHFYVGRETIVDSLLNLTDTAVHSPGRPTGLLGNVAVFQYLALYGVPLIALSWAVAFVWQWPLWQDAPRSRSLLPVTLAVTLLGLIVAHGYFGVPYPVDRTGLYLWPLAAFSWAVLTDRTRSVVARGWLVVPVFVLCIQFATQLQVRAFAVWPFNAAIKDIALRLAAECAERPSGSISVSTDYSDSRSLEFYRIAYEMECLRPIASVLQQPLEGYDFYVVSPLGKIPEKPKQILYEDHVFHSQLAR